MELEVEGARVEVKAIVTESIIEDIDVVMGMDAINQLGGVTVSHGNTYIGSDICA